MRLNTSGDTSNKIQHQKKESRMMYNYNKVVVEKKNAFLKKISVTLTLIYPLFDSS